MPSPATFPTYDRLVDGGLEPYLRECRAGGVSLRGIVTALRVDHDIRVSVETVRGWMRELDIPTERVKS